MDAALIALLGRFDALERRFNRVDNHPPSVATVDEPTIARVIDARLQPLIEAQATDSGRLVDLTAKLEDLHLIVNDLLERKKKP